MFLRMLLSALLLLHSVSFAMIVPYKNKDHKKRVEKSVCGYMEKQEITQERKRWQNLPQEEQGKYKLVRLYEKQDNPKFVTRYLKNQDVPILLISPINDKEVHGIDPYAKSFYKNPDKQIFTADPAIVEIGHLKIEIIKKLHPFSYKGSMDSCISSVILGKDEDITHECVKMDTLLQGNSLYRHFMNLGAITFAIKYPWVKNNALEVFLQREKQLTAPLMDKQKRYNVGYILLTVAAQDKKAFELIAHKDPYNSNRMLHPDLFGKKRTHLDQMKKKENKNTFDQEHIHIFVQAGGMSGAEVEGMKQVNRILRGKKTDEERFIENLYTEVINNSNRDNSNKYLEAMTVRDSQEEAARRQGEAVRLLNERLRMMLDSMEAINAMSGNNDI